MPGDPWVGGKGTIREAHGSAMPTEPPEDAGGPLVIFQPPPSSWGEETSTTNVRRNNVNEGRNLQKDVAVISFKPLG